MKNNDKLQLSAQKKWYLIAEGYSKKYRISFDEIIEILSFETTKAINKDIDPDAEIIFRVDKENQEVFIYNINAEVVSDDMEFYDENSKLDPQRITFVPLKEAKKLNSKAKEGDTPFEIEINFEIIPEKTKVAIKNGFMQNLKITEKQKIYEIYKPLIGQKIKAIVLSKNANGSYNLQFEDGVTAFLPATKTNPTLPMALGSYLDVYLENVNLENRLSICEVSTDSPNEVRDIVTNEIPEINEQLIEIVKIERIPGVRTKIALKAINQDASFDPFGSVFGEGARRILAISEKLNGEKIDVIKYSDNVNEYIKNSLSPAKVIDVVKEEDKEVYIAIVSNEEMKNAIGKKGVNIVLASRISGKKIKFLTPEEAVEKGIKFSRLKTYDRPLIGKGVRNHKRNRYFEGIDIDMSEFSKDVAQFNEIQSTPAESKPKQTRARMKSPKIDETEIDNLFSEEALAIDFDDELDYDFVDQIEYDDFDDEEYDETEIDEKETSEVEKPVYKAYKNAKVEIKDFKVDNDLANYGLDFDLDFSEIDEDWEDESKK